MQSQVTQVMISLFLIYPMGSDSLSQDLGVSALYKDSSLVIQFSLLLFFCKYAFIVCVCFERER